MGPPTSLPSQPEPASDPNRTLLGWARTTPSIIHGLPVKFIITKNLGSMDRGPGVWIVLFASDFNTIEPKFGMRMSLLWNEEWFNTTERKFGTRMTLPWNEECSTVPCSRSLPLHSVVDKGSQTRLPAVPDNAKLPAAQTWSARRIEDGQGRGICYILYPYDFTWTSAG